MDLLSLGRLPEVGIIISYSAVALFSFAGAVFVWRTKWLAIALFGIAAIFTFCCLNYLLVATHAPRSWVEVDHYFVVISGASAAIALFPFFSIRFARQVEKLKEHQAIAERSTELSGFCSVLLQWEGRDRFIILEISSAMVRWFTSTGVADPSALKIGANWVDALPHKEEWLDKIQETAIGGKAWRNMQTTSESDGGIVAWVWFLHLVDAKKKILKLEWYNSTQLVQTIQDLKCKVEIAERLLGEEQAKNSDLSRRIRLIIGEQLDSLIKETEDLGNDGD